MTDVRYETINENEDGQRIDNYLLRILKGVPRSYIYRIIRSGEVRVNKKRAQASTRVVSGDSIRIPPVRIAPEKNLQIGSRMAECLSSSIIYEDDKFLVINKPPGIPVHAGSGSSLGVIEGLRAIREDLSYLELAHRIDKETSGCLVLVKSRQVLRDTQQLFTNKEMNKTYWALLCGEWVGKKTAHIDVALEKNVLKSGERLVCVSPSGKESQTKITLLHNSSKSCWVEAQPKTGRTHQIRVHCSHIGHSIIGDEKYGSNLLIKDLGIKKRLYLHAREINFNLYGRDFSFKAELDDDFCYALDVLQSKE